jgi:hypothetical protein
MADDAYRVQAFDESYPGVLEAILAFSASRHRSVSDDEVRRLVWRIARAWGRVRNEKIREASLRRDRPRSFPERALARRRRLATAKSAGKPWDLQPGRYRHAFTKWVRYVALEHGIGHPKASVKAAAQSSAKVTKARLTRDEKRAVDILLGARRRRSVSDRDPQRLADIVVREFSGKRPVGRPPGVTTLAKWDPHRLAWRVPKSLGEFLNVALPLLAESVGVERLKISASVLELLAVLARAFRFTVRDEDVNDSFARLVRLRNRLRNRPEQ